VVPPESDDDVPAVPELDELEPEWENHDDPWPDPDEPWDVERQFCAASLATALWAGGRQSCGARA
jgi:hypothetical protein